MKTIVKTFTAAALIALSSVVIAAEKPVSKPEKVSVNLSTADFTLQHYVAVTTAGETVGLAQLFAEDFIQKIQAFKTQTYGRQTLIKSLKKQQGEILNCKTHIKIVEKSADYMVAKIVLKFDGFSMTDLVTLVYENGGWQVSKSVHSYQ
ncbi:MULTISPECIES: nuclear transport factor 2 family protein [unclassified Sphingobacterium]|uniref:nuclear transport factor 2 family protein n=1 Tax=unclassified Sphingobacterium TaxID=2609468 RepID=UPI002954F0EC|nr:nuclear transport factor 2 family protein [Sphingobacterium sp. UGAL515B_05]WON95147.1 nuclear transport factor 2 family protein [Sphingobacterium sp. UGAL515B_05]